MKTRASRIPIPTEHAEQVVLIQWADANSHQHPALLNLFAIPNGGNRNIITARKLKAEGVRAGVPDLFLAWPGNDPLTLRTAPGLFIEMKRRKGGTVSTVQLDWHKRLTKAGYSVCVCVGWDEARRAIGEYLGIRGGRY